MRVVESRGSIDDQLARQVKNISSKTRPIPSGLSY